MTDHDAFIAKVRTALEAQERNHPNTPVGMTSAEARELLAELLRLDEENRRLRKLVAE